jgi:hypothetical protein
MTYWILALMLTACGGGGGGEPRAASDAKLQHAGWEKLGERETDGHVDHDVIEIGRSDGRFREVMIEVKGGGIELYDMIFTFGDGERYEPKVRHAFDASTRSRVISLPGGERNIRRVDFKLAGGTPAHIELFAK